MINKYKYRSNRYLREASETLREGKYEQASEKYWAAAAQIVNAYAENKKIPHDGHDKLFQIVDRIAKIKQDDEFVALSGFANI